MKTQKGFTLMEILIYIAVLTGLSVLGVNSILTITRAFGTVRLTRSIDTSAAVAMERMIREIRLASNIDPTSEFDQPDGVLKLNAGLPTAIEFSTTTDLVLTVKEGGTSEEDLTQSGIEVTSLIFRKISPSENSRAVKIEIELRGTKGGFQKSEKFYGTATVLRGSH